MSRDHFARNRNELNNWWRVSKKKASNNLLTLTLTIYRSSIKKI